MPLPCPPQSGPSLSHSPSPSCCIRPPTPSVSIRIWLPEAQRLLKPLSDLAAHCTIPAQKASCSYYLPWPYDQHLLNSNLSPSNVLTRTPETKTFHTPKCFLEIRQQVVKKCYQLRALMNPSRMKTWSLLIGLPLASYSFPLNVQGV